MMGVPAIYLFLSQAAGFASADLSSLRRAVVGGAPMPETLLETWQRRGVDIVQGYGLTEAAPNVLCLPPEDAVRKTGYAGKPYPYVDARSATPPRRAARGRGEGELVVRGPNVFAGYWRNERRPPRRSTDGWLRTGDIAERDDEGYYRIRGRLKEHVHLGRRERVPGRGRGTRSQHPAVADVAVVGVPDERWGEVGAAFVVLEPGATASRGRAARVLPRRLARYKVPKSFAFVEELPRSAMNKVLKDELRAGTRRSHDRRRPTGADGRRLATAARARARSCSRRPRRLRRARLPRGVDREDHRGRRRRPGHLLPLLRARSRTCSTRSCSTSTGASATRSTRRPSRARRALEARGARLPRLLPLHRRAPGALPDHPAGRVRLARDAAATLRALHEGYVAGLARRWRRARSPRPTRSCSPGR